MTTQLDMPTSLFHTTLCLAARLQNKCERTSAEEAQTRARGRQFEEEGRSQAQSLE